MNTQHLLRQWAVAVIMLWLTATATVAQPTYRSAELKRLVSVLALNIDSLQEGQNILTCKDRQVKVQIKNGQVSFVGYDLFHEELKAMSQTPVFSFLERYFLQLDHPTADRPRDRMMREDRFKFETGNMATVATLRPDDAISFNCDNKRFTVSWSRHDEPLLAVSFPASHELISGENKIEAEKNIEGDILAAIVTKGKPVNKSTLTPTIQKDFLIQKGSTFITDRLNSDLYYRIEKGSAQSVDGGTPADSYTLFADISHPLESSANMMLSTDCQQDYTLKMKQVMYGFKKKYYDVPLRSWIAFCRNNGCELYYGIESLDKDIIKASVVAANTQENYTHLLFVNIPLSVIENNGGDIEAQLDAFIPMHNVLTLFGKDGRNKNKDPKIYE